MPWLPRHRAKRPAGSPVTFPVAVLGVPATVALFPAVRHPSIATPLTHPLSLNPVVMAIVVTILPIPRCPDVTHPRRWNGLVDRRRRSDINTDINPRGASSRRQCDPRD